MNSGSETSTSNAEPKRRSGCTKWFILLLLLIGGGVAGYFKFQDLVAKELVAMARLRELGVICSNSSNFVARKIGDGKHVGTASLATVDSKEELSEAIGLLKDLPFLKSIDLAQSRVTDEDLTALAKAKRVTSLNLSQTAVTDEGFKHLTGLRNLESLYLAGSQITQNSLPAVSRLKKVRMLDLSGSKITGKLEPLGGLARLEWLLLGGLAIEDNSLSSLSTCAQLQKLHLEGTSFVDESSLEKLTASNKAIRVVR